MALVHHCIFEKPLISSSLSVVSQLLFLSISLNLTLCLSSVVVCVALFSLLSRLRRLS